MPARISTALSKVAAEHRRNNQIPRKRPLNVPPPPTYQAPKDKKAQPKNKKRKRNSSIPARQIRGEKRTNTPGHNGDPWPVRRILASRPDSRDPSVTRYKVQWETSWEDSSSIQGPVVEEWQAALKNDETFPYLAKDGVKWTVLKDETRGENDHEDMQWDFWVAIHRNVMEEIQKDWFQDVKEDAFEFADGGEGDMVARMGRRGSTRVLTTRSSIRPSLSALQTLRAAWQYSVDNPQVHDEDIPYCDMKVRYVGRLDPRHAVVHGATRLRPALSVAHIIRTLQSHNIFALNVNTFTKSQDTYATYTHWRDTICTLIQNAPFIFRSGTWIQLLALLFLSGDMFRSELQKVGVNVAEDWPSRAREYAIHMYYEKILDDRAPHDIQETFLCLREFFRNLKPDDEEETDVIMSSPDSLVGTDGQRLPPLEDLFTASQNEHSPISTLRNLEEPYRPSSESFDNLFNPAKQPNVSSQISGYRLSLPPGQLPVFDRRFSRRQSNVLESPTIQHTEAVQQERGALLERLIQLVQQETAQRESTSRIHPAVHTETRRVSAAVSERRRNNRQELLTLAESLDNRTEGHL